MKTKQIALMLLAVVLTVSAIAIENPKMNVVALKESKAYVVAKTNPFAATEISILNEEGEVIYYKRSKASREFKSVLNLSQLEDGLYKVQLESGKASASRNLEIMQGKIKVQQLKPELAPVFSYDGNMLRCSYLNFNQNNVSILVYNGSTLVYQAPLGNNFNIQRAFDVSKMVKGKFEFVLDGSSKDYCYTLYR